MGALLIALLAVEPAVGEPPPPSLRPDQQQLHLWTEPVTLVRNFTEAGGGTQPVVIPIGFEYLIEAPTWFAAELTLLYTDTRSVGTIVGAILALGLQFAVGHLGPISFYVEPRFTGAFAHQHPEVPVRPGTSCMMGCLFEATELEVGVGANFGAAVAFHAVYLSLELGGGVAYYNGGTDPIAGDPFVVLKKFIVFNETGFEISPNLSFVRIGGTF